MIPALCAIGGLVVGAGSVLAWQFYDMWIDTQCLRCGKRFHSGPRYTCPRCDKGSTP